MPNTANEKSQSVPVSRKKNKLFWDRIYCLAMFVYALLIIILTLVGFTHLASFTSSDDHKESEEIERNWKRNYIKNITTVDSDEDCPTDFEVWHDREWPGMERGCSCINTDGDFDKIVTAGACTELQINSQCENVNKRDSAALFRWQDDIKLCIERGNTSFATSPSNCDEGYQRCGTDEVRYCLPEGEECPISDAFISTTVYFEGYTRLSLGNGRYFFFTRNNNQFPISKFDLTEYALCIFTDDDNIYPGRRDYVLLNEKRENCYASEQRFVVIETMGEKDVYINNNIYDELKSIPGYPRPDNDFIWKLGFVRYYDWNDKCRNGPYSIDEAIEKIGLDTPLRISLAVFLTASIIVIITGIIMPVRHLKRRHREEDIRRAYQINKPKKQKMDFRTLFTSGNYLLDKSLKFILLPAIMLQIFFIRRDSRWFVAVEENSCGDIYTYARFQKIQDALDYLYDIYGAVLAIWLLVLIGDVLFAIYVICKSPKVKRKQIRVVHHRDGKEDEFEYGFERLPEQHSVSQKSGHSGVVKRNQVAAIHISEDGSEKIIINGSRHDA